MKKLFLIIFLFLLFQIEAKAIDETSSVMSEAPPVEIKNAPETSIAEQNKDIEVFSKKNRFGLRDKKGNVIIPPTYQKLIRVGKSGWIAQKGVKYGLINSKGEILIKPKYRSADRLLGRFVKLGNDGNFGIYNEFGETVIPPEYNSIDLLYGRMFLTYKNYRYGVSDFSGKVLIPNVCDDIYMSEKTVMNIKYKGEWYEIDEVSIDKLVELRKNAASSSEPDNILSTTGTLSEYSILTFSDYFIKIFSSISPAHEDTIDDLILSHGVDTINILKKFSWIPKYPITFGKNYYAHLRNPFSGPLSDKRSKLINKRQKNEDNKRI